MATKNEANHLTTRSLPVGDRPYEKLEARGATALSDAELVAVLIRSGTRGENSLSVAQRLLLRFGEAEEGLGFLAESTLEELRGTPGIGRVKAMVLKAAVEVGRRATRTVSARLRERIHDPESLTGGILDEMRLLEREELWIVLLDVKGCLLRTLRFAGGGIASTVILPRDLFREAVRSGASAMVLAHNHPSGDPEPSEQDRDTTARLVAAGETIGIRIVDHIVVASGGYVSFKRRGLV